MAASDADRLRIAIALTALKFKPADQSCASYVLRLRSLFPPSTPTAPTADGSWKNHALALEKSLATLKEKYERQQIKALATAAAPVSDAAPSSSQVVKRKQKKKGADKRPDAPARADLETVLEDLNGRPEFVSLPMSNSLFSTVSAFQQLTDALNTSAAAVTAAQRSLLLSTTTRALTALSNVLHPILRSTEMTVVSQATTLQALARIVHDLISSSLPLLLRQPTKNASKPATVSTLLNKLLDSLISLVFHPLLESFTSLSHRYLTSLFAPTAPTTLPVDLRPDVLHLFQSIFSPLVAAPSNYDINLRSTLALTTLRELEGLFPPRRTEDTRPPWTHCNRVQALVRKDAFWYLCTILHVLFAPIKDCSTSGSAVRVDGAVSERRITDVLSRIINRCRKCQDSAVGGGTDACNDEIPDRDSNGEEIFEGPSNELDLDVIDEVGYGMILGIMEQYWRWTGEVQQDVVP
ncbi:hypothetical protein DFH07DRAFT_853960 [Mycena maculata]|uniref:Uncharacterized protein n=1 Tax=Mycena maculata TaxID=230809 RepID=A0AAD7MNC3_9AGAR|nr:hypothetical protein DFH07DRAFT_853960 [Mycena maculata]